MKHIIYLFFAFFTCINISEAQVAISSRDLDGTKWKFSKSIYEYQNGKEIWHRSDGSTFTYQYYLSNTIPKSFDFSKVGQNAQGRYLIEYNPILDSFRCYSIVRFDKKEKIMSFKLETKDVIGNTGISNFTLIYSPKSNPKSTYDTPLERIYTKEDDVLKRDTSTGGNTTTSGKTSTSGNSSTGKSTSTSGRSTTKDQTNKYIDSKDPLTPLKGW